MYGLTCVHTLCRNNKAEYRDVTAKHLRLYNNDVFLRLSLLPQQMELLLTIANKMPCLEWFKYSLERMDGNLVFSNFIIIGRPIIYWNVLEIWASNSLQPS